MWCDRLLYMRLSFKLGLGFDKFHYSIRFWLTNFCFDSIIVDIYQVQYMPIFLKKKKLLTNKIYMRISYYITILIKVRIIWFVYKDLNYTQWNFYNNYNYIIIFLLQFDFLK